MRIGVHAERLQVSIVTDAVATPRAIDDKVSAASTVYDTASFARRLMLDRQR